MLAAKRATIQANGRTFDVVEPEILDAAAALPQITPRRRSVWQRLGITDYVKLKFAPTGDTLALSLSSPLAVENEDGTQTFVYRRSEAPPPTIGPPTFEPPTRPQ